MKRCILLALLFALACQGSAGGRAAAGEFFTSPRIEAGSERGGGLWAAFQASEPYAGTHQYELRRFDRRDAVWYDMGRFNGVLAGMAGRDSELWVATRDGALVRPDGETPAALPQNDVHLEDIAWHDGRVVGLNFRNGEMTLLTPAEDMSWTALAAPAIPTTRPQQARLLSFRGELHAVWTGDNRALSEGAVRHMILRDNLWTDAATIPLGEVQAFSLYADRARLRLAAKTRDPAGEAGNGRVVAMSYGENGWETVRGLSEAAAASLAACHDFALAKSGDETAWLTLDAAGVRAWREAEDGRVVQVELAASADGESAWSSVLSLLLTALTIFLVVRSSRKSRALSRAFPGRPADVVSRAVAIFIDSAIVSIGVGTYHIAAGDINIYEELFTARAMHELFWINLGALALFAAVLEAASGRTPGKWLMGIRVRNANGGPAGVSQCLIRNIFRGVDMFPVLFPGLVGAIATLFNRRRQRIGDLLGGTVVRRHAPLSARSIVLASASPRRKELLEAAGLRFRCQPAFIDESAISGRTPGETARKLAEAKARAVLNLNPNEDAVVVAADTMVVLDGAVLGKPADPADAKLMLSLLSGRSHRVLTGVAVFDPATQQLVANVEETEVEFRNLSEEEIDRYVASGDPMDKAGAYGIQSGYLVRQIRGSLSNVAGLPMEMLWDLLGMLDS